LDAPLKIWAIPSWYACSVPKNAHERTRGQQEQTLWRGISKPLTKSEKLENSNTDPSQTTIGDCGKLRRICMMDDETKAEILSSMVDFVVDNKQAFRVVESPSLQSFAKL
jgi:hypothetical protein